MALAHQFLLDEVLDFLDADDVLSEIGHATGHAGGDAHGRGRILLKREKGHAHRDGDFIGEPWHDLAVAAHQAGRDRDQIHGVGTGSGPREEEALRDVVAVVADERVLDGLEYEGFTDFDARGVG